MEFFLYAFIITLYYVYAGIGLTLLIIPKEFEKYFLHLSPFAGLALLSFFSWFFFEYSSWGTDQYVFLLLIPPLLFLIAAFIKKGERIRSIFHSIEREECFLLLLCVILFLAVSYPYYSNFDGISTTISYFNNDIADYAATSKYLMVSSNTYSPIPFVEGVTPRFSLGPREFYFSAFLSTALPSSLLHLQSFQIQNLVMNLFYIFSLLLLYIISREILDYTRFFSLLVTLLIGLNIHLLYILFNGFFGQILGVGFFLGLFLTMYYPLMKNKEGNTFLTFLPLNCLFCYGLVSSYHILVPLFFCPLGLFIMAYYVHS